MSEKLKRIEIVQGSDFEIPFVLTLNGLQQPLGLGSVPPDDITILLPTPSGSLVKKLSGGATQVVVTSDPRGEFKVVGSEVDSLAMKEDIEQNVVVKIKRGTEDIVVELKGILDVIKPSLTE